MKKSNQVHAASEENAGATDSGEEADREEEMTQHPGWILVIVGAVIAIIGIVWLFGPSIPWLGKLPGDIAIEGKGLRFYFPVATCIVLSLVLTGIMWLFRFFSR